MKKIAILLYSTIEYVLIKYKKIYGKNMNTSLENDDSLKSAVWDLSRLEKEFESFEKVKEVASVLQKSLLDKKDVFPMENKNEMFEFLTNMDKLVTLSLQVSAFAFLQTSIDCNNEQYSNFESLVEDWWSEIEASLVFVEIELSKSDEVLNNLIEDEKFSFCKRYLEDLKIQKQFFLEENQEQLLAELYPSAVGAWKKLYEDSISQLEIITKDGSISLDVAISGLFSQDEEVRKQNSNEILKAVENDILFRVKALDNVVRNNCVEVKYRKYTRWDHETAISYGISLDVADSLVDAVNSNFALSQNWHKYLAQRFNEEKLSWHNRLAPLVETKEEYISLESAKEIVKSAYYSADEEFGKKIEEFFDSDSIHAISSKGKISGAYCMGISSGIKPYVLLNWGGSSDDVVSLAHECGHALHDIMSFGNSSYQYSPPLVLAETASVFGEMITTDYLLNTTSDPKIKAKLLSRSVNDNLTTIFRQIAYYNFEKKVHEYRTSNGELSKTKLQQFWLEEQRRYYGDFVEIPDGVGNSWSYVGHFMSIAYVYSYAFGQLLTISLYEKYKNSKDSSNDTFMDSYKKLLSFGGSKSPKDAVAVFDIDISKPEFWLEGMNLLENTIQKAINAVNLVK